MVMAGLMILVWSLGPSAAGAGMRKRVGPVGGVGTAAGRSGAGIVVAFPYTVSICSSEQTVHNNLPACGNFGRRTSTCVCGARGEEGLERAAEYVEFIVKKLELSIALG
jgi:hypothetical protein